MEYVTLNNGVKMPILGFGVYQVPDEKECEQCVYDALMAGYRLIDTAAVYKNERAVGKAIKRSGIPREEIFITTKLWVQDYGYEKTKKAFQHSMVNLGVDYLDLYLLHQCFSDTYGSWRALEELYKEGKVRAIGISNFANDRIVDFCVNQEITPAVCQIEIHPFLQENSAIKVMEDFKITPEAWGPFNEGKGNIFKNEILCKIAKKYNKTSAQVMLRWNIQRGVVVIPKSVHKERIIENFNVFDFKLSDEDMAEIAKLDTGKSTIVDHFDPSFVKAMNSYKFTY